MPTLQSGGTLLCLTVSGCSSRVRHESASLSHLPLAVSIVPAWLRQRAGILSSERFLLKSPLFVRLLSSSLSHQSSTTFIILMLSLSIPSPDLFPQRDTPSHRSEMFFALFAAIMMAFLTFCSSVLGLPLLQGTRLLLEVSHSPSRLLIGARTGKNGIESQRLVVFKPTKFRRPAFTRYEDVMIKCKDAKCNYERQQIIQENAMQVNEAALAGNAAATGGVTFPQ